jgi:hypothetical protein
MHSLGRVESESRRVPLRPKATHASGHRRQESRRRQTGFVIWALGAPAAALGFALGLVLLDVGEMPAQTMAPESKRALRANEKTTASAPASPQQQMSVSTEQALYLIRSTLLTLNDANRSGNYTVLRDLAAPDFQARNTAADLAQSFSDLRRRNFDLYAAALFPPQLTTVPAIDKGGCCGLPALFRPGLCR